MPIRRPSCCHTRPWLFLNKCCSNVWSRFVQTSHRPKSAEPAEWRIVSSRPLPEASQDLHFGSRNRNCILCHVSQRLRPGNKLGRVSAKWLVVLATKCRPGLASVCWWPSHFAPVGKLSDSLPDPQCRWRRPGLPLSSSDRRPTLRTGLAGLRKRRLGFDPLCGDGSGHAAREAILASAIVRAAMPGGGHDELTEHYRARLLAGLARTSASVL